MQPEPRQTSPVQRDMEAAPQPPVVYVPADVVDEDEVILRGEPLTAAEAVERLRSLVDQRHRPNPPRLRGALAAVREIPPDVDESLLEVAVAPSQRSQLAESKPRERGDPEQRGVLVGLGSAGERLNLGWVEDREVPGPAQRLTINKRS